MNNYLKIAIGAVAGAGVGWFIGSVIVEYIDIMEERRNEDYIDALVVDEDGNETEENQRPIEMSKNKQTKRDRKVDYSNAFVPNESDKPELAALVARYNQGILPSEEPAAPPENEEEWEDEDLDNADSGPIRIINVAEYAASDSGYEQITLLYFDDDVVSDSNRKVLKDPESFIGEEALISFGVLSDKEDTVYIRNDDRKQEYEVVRMDEPFIHTKEPMNRKPSRFDHVQEEEDEGEDAR